MAKISDNTNFNNEEVEAKVDEFAQKLEILRVRYEQYFIGVEKVPPVTLRMDVARIMRELEQMKVRNTALKFKIRTNVQKFVSYSTYWNRTLREIEDGTYKRHVDKAKRQQAEQERKAKRGPARKKEDDAHPEMMSAIADEAEAFLASLGSGLFGGNTASDAVKPAHAQPAVTAPAAGPSITGAAAKPAIIQPAAKPAIVQPAAKPAITGAAAKPAIIQPAARPAIVQPAAKPAVTGAAARPAIIQPAARPAIIQPAAKTAITGAATRPAAVQPAAKPAITGAKPAIVQPAAKPTITGAKPTITGAAARPAIVRPAFIQKASTKKDQEDS